MTVIHIVRHGETVWHAENRYTGHTDVPLTPLGLAQGENLVPWARKAHLDVVMSSDLSRARLTAQPVADALSLQLHVDPMLREVNFGQGEGLTPAEMQHRFPDARAAFEATPASSALPGGESGGAAVERALPIIASVMTAAEANTGLFVIHSTLGRLLLCEFLGIDRNFYRRIFPAFVNGAINSVSFDNPKTVSDFRGTGALLTLNAAP
jgi:broad specificity phosphatase PhoE